MGIVKEPLPPSSLATTASSLPAQGMKQNSEVAVCGSANPVPDPDPGF